MDIKDLYSIYQSFPNIQTDTRQLKPGELFFALKGDTFDGNLFASQAIELGAPYAIIDEPTLPRHQQYLHVRNVLGTLQELAHYHRRQLAIPFIAITGSNGKTTTKELVAAVLAKQYNVGATVGNLNNHIGVPLTLLRLRADAEIAIVEMGANHQSEIASYCQIAEPTHGLITNVGKAHIEGFGGLSGVRKGKGELFDFLKERDGIVFLNKELDYLDDMSLGIRRRITYGRVDADFIGQPLSSEPCLHVAIMNRGKEVLIKTNLFGVYNFSNVMAAVAVGLHFGVAIDAIKEAIEAYLPDNSRSQILTCGSNTVILDAYNANPTSMQAAIRHFAASQFAHKQLWIGGMKEMGDAERSEHEAIVELIQQFDWDKVILVGHEFECAHEGFLWFRDSASAAQYVIKNQPYNAAILIKGSRGSRMETMLKAL